jgi:hypothetical protein
MTSRVLKSISLKEATSLHFRFEGFNAFNQARFGGPASANGNRKLAPPAGRWSAQAPPRLTQAALKLIF